MRGPLTSSNNLSANRSPACKPGNPSHQRHWGRLLSVLHLWCSPGCCLSRPCSRYSFRSMKPGSSQHWGLSWIFIMPVSAFQSNRHGLMLSKLATVIPLTASHTPMLPNIVRTQTKRSWAILPSNNKMSGQKNPSSLLHCRLCVHHLQLLHLPTRSSS